VVPVRPARKPDVPAVAPDAAVHHGSPRPFLAGRLGGEERVNTWSRIDSAIPLPCRRLRR